MSKTERLAREICAARGAPALLDQLRALAPSELGSVLLAVFEGEAEATPASRLRAQAEELPLFAPSSADARELLELDRLALAAAERFEALELAPVAPRGTSARSGISPNNVLSALRGAECAADPTALLALSAAARRRLDRGPTVRLAASQRVIRLQPFDLPGFTPHFRLFTLATAGRDQGSERFERQALREQLSVWLALLSALEARGYAVGAPRVELSDVRVVRALLADRGLPLERVRAAVRGHRPGSSEALLAGLARPLPQEVHDPARELGDEPACAPFLPELTRLAEEVLAPLAADYPEAQLSLNLSRLHGLGYYQGSTLRIGVGDPARPAFVADGGLVDWTQALLQDRKERLLCSAIGSELLVKAFRRKPPSARPVTRNSLSVEVHPSGIWQLSSVLLTSGGRSWVVDPGYFPRELAALAARAAAQGEVEGVVFTHGHWDHVLGWRSFPRAAVLGSPRLAAAVERGSPEAARNLDAARDFDGRWYVDRGGPLAWPGRVEPLADGTVRRLGTAEVEVLCLPGHSADGLALLLRAAGLLIAGDYLSPLEIPFVEDLAAYRATLRRLLGLLPQLEQIIPGHGPRLSRAEAEQIARADLDYLDALGAAVESGDRAGAEALPLPRAAGVPGMREHHGENVAAAFGPAGPVC